MIDGKICPVCKNSFVIVRRKDQVYCSRSCQEKAYRMRRKGQNIDKKTEKIMLKAESTCIYCGKPILEKNKYFCDMNCELNCRKLCKKNEIKNKREEKRKQNLDRFREWIKKQDIKTLKDLIYIKHSFNGEKYKIAHNELIKRKNNEKIKYTLYEQRKKRKELFCFIFDGSISEPNSISFNNIPKDTLQYSLENKSVRKKRVNNSNKNKDTPYKTNSKFRYNIYKNSAKKRNIKFNLSYQDCFLLFNSCCWYCGYECPNGSLTGIDRIDASKGYTIDNVVPCCKRCNYMKGTVETKLRMTQEEYLEQISKIYNYKIKEKNIV